MKTLISVCLALALAIPVMAWTQSSSQQSDSQSQNSQNQPYGQNQSSATQSGTQGQQNQQQMSGKVSNNGKTFTTDQGNKYTLDNPDMLSSQAGQEVTVLVTVDPDTGDLHIIQLATPSTSPR